MPGSSCCPGSHPITPVMFPGDDGARRAAEIADHMLGNGVYVIAFSFPVVPRGQGADPGAALGRALRGRRAGLRRRVRGGTRRRRLIGIRPSRATSGAPPCRGKYPDNVSCPAVTVTSGKFSGRSPVSRAAGAGQDHALGGVQAHHRAGGAGRDPGRRRERDDDRGGDG